MPFCKGTFTFEGGCKCKAVRYRVFVPPWQSRIALPYKSEDADIKDRLPVSIVCHCNNCREATGQIGTQYVALHALTFKISSRKKTDEPSTMTPDREDSEWLHGKEFEDNFDTSSWLTGFASSPGRRRWFCARCGTPVAYTIDEGKGPEGWPPMVDVILGTVDRAWLEREDFKPDHSLWTALGVPWVREQLRDGAVGMAEHPLIHVDKKMGDDISSVVEWLSSMGASVEVTIPQ
ncbi:hypothetical protein FMEXI_4408 [Fusarium mexicanum]|uniref:CENP-V/GFA domain-containing protein n=1 Tax=Fusarium mexicanum TaxID=751941 RepID=A0A8H5N0H0_9HYPO|nr:hypothetical protein FMEXI_4408 [Fusarium mexicanum]